MPPWRNDLSMDTTQPMRLDIVIICLVAGLLMAGYFADMLGRRYGLLMALMPLLAAPGVSLAVARFLSKHVKG